MKNKKILAVGLCGAICLSLAGFTYANALASDAPKNLASETENTSGVDILYQKCFNPHCIATKKRVPRALVQASLLFVKYLT